MQKVKFENGRGRKLVGNYHEADSDAGIVMSHGFTGDKHEWGYFDKVAEALNEAGYNVLAFDFSGGGESNKSPITAEKEIEDLDAAIEYIRSRDVERVGLYGHSLGGYISLKNYRSEVKAMVLTAPVTSSIDLSKKNLLWTVLARLVGRVPSVNYWKNKKQLMWIGSKIVDEMKHVDQEELLSEVGCPVLIIHGSEDEVVDLEDSKKAVEKLEAGELKVVEGLTHDYDKNLDEVIEATESWFDENLST
ncbi:alpha/beta hydrolase [Candidatus Nanohalovita haloferacivicina]|uniref:alpha/beta hydrolase n=1 Tax=Candidatus Nanohalovita haloferacivicina TaxID=2978046 RepID=UPI00325F9956|nr:Alpha/beta hydrolase [Candidatus Nanohalobia archaeon BNXNv]